MNYTPEEVAKLLANRPNQPHYIAALIAECVDTERAKWREVALRVAKQANAYGREGLTMRCTISDTGSIVSWEMDRA